ncbi:MAG TPA: zinc-binding alcohol dehydrogenase family protein [Phycisphaerae bacterium]|nr:zinc-binding alcohol dehydrogenase family protein [Phycisphaerae bacterium]
MQAVVIRQFGDPRLLKVEEVPTPEPRDGEALVEVKAAAINPSDVKNVQGVMHGTTLPRIPGRDFAGVVVKGPADMVGKEVFGTGGDIGFTRDGSHAQFILLPAAALTIKPVKLSMDAAGSAGVTFVTAWSTLVSAANTSPDDTVLIIGAGGGVGSAAVQIAKARGARVIGAILSDEDAAHVRANGADETINSKTGDLIQTVGSMTKNVGASVILDTSGVMFAEGVEAAAFAGRLVVISAPADGKATFNLRSIYRKELQVIGVDTRALNVVVSAKLLEQMRFGFESGAFKVNLGEARPLAAAAETYGLAAQGNGRFYLRPND